MKKLFFVSLVVTAVALTACQPQQTTIEGDQEVTNEEQAQNDEATLGQVKKRIADMQKKFVNPKQSTLYDQAYKKQGKAYMIYDKEADKTYFWMETTIESDQPLTVSLKNNSAKDETKKEISVGKLHFGDEGTGMLFYEFENAGNQYGYLHVIVKGEGEDAQEYVANFNPKLS